MTTEVLVTPAIDIQVVFAADGSRVFQVRFAPIPMDTTKDQLDKTMDLVLGCVERQRAKYELEDEEALLSAQVDRLKKYQGMVVSIEEMGKNLWESEGRRGEWSIDKLSPNAKNERERINISLQNDRHDATARQAKIGRLKAKVNGHAADFGADSRSG